ETWGDARAADGTVGLQQPLIEPLLDGRSASEILALLAGLPADPRALLASLHGPALPDGLRQGFLPGTATSPLPLAPDAASVLEAVVTAVVEAVVPLELEI